MTMRTRTTARTVGILFLIATAAGLLSVSFLGTREALGAFMIVIMAAAIAMIPAMMYPILKRHNEALALGYVVNRIIEVVLLLPAAVAPLMLLALKPEQSTGTLENLRSTYATWGTPVSAVFFCVSVVLLNYLLFRAHLVPRFISVWALLAVAPYFVDALAVMFGVLSPTSPLHSALFAPLALNEMVLALWLLIKGFRPSTLDES